MALFFDQPWFDTRLAERGLTRAVLAAATGLTEADLTTGTKTFARLRGRSLSAIVACYKDGEAIPIMYRRLTDTFQKLGIDYEIILNGKLVFFLK